MMNKRTDDRFRYAYKFRIYPNKEQEILINKTFGCCRYVYNGLLSDAQKQYEETGKSKVKSYKSLYTDENTWLKEVDSLALSNTQRNVKAAYSNFFTAIKKDEHRELRFKCKYDRHKSYTTNNNSMSARKTKKIEIHGDYLKLPKLGLVRCVFHREVVGDIKSVTVSKNPSGQYHASILVARNSEDEPQKLPKTNKKVGVDVGKKSYATMSDGSEIKKQQWLINCDKKIAKLQRELSRKEKGSKNWEKARVKLAKAYQYKTNRMDHFLHNVTIDLIRKNDVIAVENLSIAKDEKSMVRAKKKQGQTNKQRKKENHDTMNMSWYKFRQMLTYKSKWYDRVLVVAQNTYASSQICNKCGYKNPITKDVMVRKYICPECGTVHDRDLNASINLINLYNNHDIENIDESASVNLTL